MKGGKDKGGLLAQLKGAKKPAVIVGPGVLNRPDRDAVLAQVGALSHSTHCTAPGEVFLKSFLRF